MAYHSCMGDKICLLMTSAPKVAQKYPQQFCVKSKIFRHGPKVSLKILTLFVTRFVHTTFKNRPIWSRCFSGKWNYTNSLLEQLWTLSLHHFLILLNVNETGNYSRVERRRDERGNANAISEACQDVACQEDFTLSRPRESLPKLTRASKQCDQMARLFIQYLVTTIVANLPNRIKIAK